MTVTAMEYVEAPPLTPAAYGILSAALVVDDANPHMGFGFQYQPDFCGPARMTTGVCLTDPNPKVSESGRDTVTGEPFVVYALSDCKTVGNTDAQARARRALTSGEGRAVEEWLGARLTAEMDDHSGTWTAGSDAEALAALEHYIHCNYGGVGTIHMQRGTASGLLTAQALVTSGNRLMTKLGNIVSAGCYDVSSGDVMWATGTVTLRRGPVGGPAQPVLDPMTNDLFALAERPYAGAWECFAVGIHVQATP